MNYILSKSWNILIQKNLNFKTKLLRFKTSQTSYKLCCVAGPKRINSDETGRCQKNLNPNFSKLVNYFYTTSQQFTSVVVKAPSFPDSVADGDLRWKKKQGETVNADELIAEIETDKVALPVPSPSAGTITELLVQEGAQVKSETPLCTIEVK